MPGTLMKCGHTAQATRQSDGKEVCIICFGISPGADEPADEVPDLSDRTAECSYKCGKTQPSSVDLAFFEHRPGKATDIYYCGCWGWD